MYAANDHFS